MNTLRFFLIDAHSLIYQAYFALENLSSSKGFPTGGIYGFLNLFEKIRELYKPDYILVAFDESKKTFRTKISASYKEHREPTPQLLIPQIKKVKDILSYMGIEFLSISNYEADDIIGTAVQYLEKIFEGEIWIVSPDKDLYQLLSPKVKILKHHKQQFFIIDEKYFKEKYGITPSQMVDYLALVGDTSDNIPGAKGIGPKTATKLLKKYGTVENIYKNIDKITPERIKNLLIKYKDDVFLSRELATIYKDININLEPIEKWKFPSVPKNIKKLVEIFKELEFFSFIEKYQKRKRNSFPKIKFLKDFNMKEIKYPIAIGYNNLLKKILILDDKDYAFLMPIENFPVFFNGETFIYDLKNFYHFLNKNNINVDFNAYDFVDIKILEHLLYSHIGKYDLPYLAKKYLSIDWEEKIVKKENTIFPVIDEEKLAQKTWLIKEIGKKILKEAKEKKLYEYYFKIEKPISYILFNMEKNGILINIKGMENLLEELDEKTKEIENKIYEISGEKFNLNSPKQLSYILFKKLKLPPIQKTKTGYSTNAFVLEVLAQKHELPKLILQYRYYEKLITTYLKPLVELARKGNGRIHTTFHQTATATGRLSSSDPNLQNIPIKGEFGEKIRSFFISKEGYKLISADYSQIELRVIAHMSKDEKMISYFNKDLDIHKMTASKIFNCELNLITKEMRSIAKAVNFGLIYGKTAFGLSQELGISTSEAKKFIERYFSEFSGVHEYINKILSEALKTGEVKTLFGRRRFIPELLAKNKNLKESGKRQAINTIIQGTAAEIIKLAMIKIQEKIENEEIYMILQIHDELLFEVKESLLEKAVSVIKDIMENVIDFTVPLKVSINVSECWSK